MEKKQNKHNTHWPRHLRINQKLKIIKHKKMCVEPEAHTISVGADSTINCDKFENTPITF